MIDLSIPGEDLYKLPDGSDPEPFMRPAMDAVVERMAKVVAAKVVFLMRSNERHLVSRNKREGWYAGWRPLLSTEGHRRSGKPLDGADWIPYPHPLKKSIVKRFEGPIDVQILW